MRPELPFNLGGSEGERAYAALLDALVRERIRLDAASLEMDTTARRSMAEVKAEEVAMAEDERAQARRQLRAFREAIEDAYARSMAGARSGAEGSEVTYDSADPEDDARADQLIGYLVRTGYGEVRTEESAPGHYLYHLTVDWDGLHRLATEQGVSLPLPPAARAADG
jgi:hypothetical protein